MVGYDGKMYSVVAFQGDVENMKVEVGYNTDKVEVAYMIAHRNSVANPGCYVGIRFNLDSSIFTVFVDGVKIYDTGDNG
jgi:hypothetical protein